jgi:hypothetical protein
MGVPPTRNRPRSRSREGDFEENILCLGKVSGHRMRVADPAFSSMCSIAKRSLRAQTAATEADRRLAGQVPLFAVSILQHNVTFHTQRTVRSHRNVYYRRCFIRLRHFCIPASLNFGSSIAADPGDASSPRSATIIQLEELAPHDRQPESLSEQSPTQASNPIVLRLQPAETAASTPDH